MKIPKDTKGRFVKGIKSDKKGKTYEEIYGRDRANEIKRKIGIKSKNRTPWNKDKKTGIVPKTAFKKGQHVSLNTEFKKGNISWSRGLTKEDPRIRKIAEKTSKTLRKLYKEGKITSWNKKEPIIKVCESCGKNFPIQHYRKDTEKFCSMECYAKAMPKMRLGHPVLIVTREKIRKKRLERKKRLGYINAPEVRAKISMRQKEMYAKGLIRVSHEPKGLEARKKISATKQGIPFEEWEGFKSFEEYDAEFSISKKRKIRKKYKDICQLCNGGITKKLGGDFCIHHIDHDKKNSRMDNLVLLCRKCHSKIHNNKRKNYWINFFYNKKEEEYG